MQILRKPIVWWRFFCDTSRYPSLRGWLQRRGRRCSPPLLTNIMRATVSPRITSSDFNLFIIYLMKWMTSFAISTRSPSGLEEYGFFYWVHGSSRAYQSIFGALGNASWKSSADVYKVILKIVVATVFICYTGKENGCCCILSAFSLVYLEEIFVRLDKYCLKFGSSSLVDTIQKIVCQVCVCTKSNGT